MKPKTKFQKQVVEASTTLPKLTDTQIKWGYDNAIQYVGQRTEKGIITCTKCSHSWEGMGELAITLLGFECPNCKTKLIVKTSRKRTFDDSYYMTIITAHKGYQVIRTVLLSYKTKVGELPQYTYSEVVQRWIAPDGKYCTFARLRQTMGTMYYDSWLFHTPLELRTENANNKYCISIYDRIDVGGLYPRQQLIPELKRTGIKKRLFKQKPFDVYRSLLSDSRMETLLKAEQSKLFELFLKDKSRKIDNYWASIRICMRNNYLIKDAITWCDYIDMLRFFEKDMHNAKYVCPTKLKAEHDRYMAKKAKADAELEIQKLLDKEDTFREVKAKFFGLVFSDELISVRVLESVAEIITEGKMMHHCVGGYYSKEDSLILSATIDGKRIETIEISLSQLRVIQSRGVCNKNTEYHDRIINLVESNISVIEERMVA